jgi:hypothetical protein
MPAPTVAAAAAVHVAAVGKDDLLGRGDRRRAYSLVIANARQVRRLNVRTNRPGSQLRGVIR